MKAVSLFSGIGGLDYGLEFAGVETVLQVERDAWCRAVLAHHWPEVERIDDVRSVDAALFQQLGDDQQRRSRGSDTSGRDAIDLVHGGFPCQDVSVAGKRAGLAGGRSSLWFEFRRVVSILRPRWVVVENVPGLLSSGPTPGADFGVVLRGLVDLGYGVAWRVLDARHFGVPQRRRRVFVVGCLGDAPRAAQVLAVCESCGGHSQARREARQDVACTLDDGARRASVELPMIVAWRHHEDDENLILARGLTARESGYRMDWETENFVVDGQNAAVVDDVGALGTGAARGNRGFMVAETVRSHPRPGSNSLGNMVASPDRASDGHHGWSGGRGDGADNLIPVLAAGAAVAYQTQGSNVGEMGTFKGEHTGSGVPFLTGDFGVRRLTPLECERLQAFPDGWTDLVVDGKPIPDSHRYRMLGNAVATVVAQYVGHRLVAVDQML